MGFGQGGVERVKSVKINRAQLNNRKRAGYFSSPQGSNKNFGEFEDHKKMSPAQFAKFKAEVKQRETANARRLAITFGVAMLIIVGLVVYFLFCF